MPQPKPLRILAPPDEIIILLYGSIGFYSLWLDWLKTDFSDLWEKFPGFCGADPSKYEDQIRIK
jgi:hypothetical protein